MAIILEILSLANRDKVLISIVAKNSGNTQIIASSQ